MKIEIKCSFSGSVLFTHEAEANSQKITLEAAVKAGANLAGANLAGANLAGANLAGANLAGANLARANLAGANLAGANLDGANLDGANRAGAYLADAYLDGANLAGANLAGAYLAGANLAGETLTKAPISLLNLKWNVLITARFMRIGCQRHDHDTWKQFTDYEIGKMSPGALEFWTQWKGPMLAMCDAYRDDLPDEGAVQ